MAKKIIKSTKQLLVEDTPSKFRMDYSKATVKELTTFKELNDQELNNLEKEIFHLMRSISRLEIENRNISLKALKKNEISSIEQIGTSEEAFEYTIGKEHFFSTSHVLTSDEIITKMQNNQDIIEYENSIIAHQKLQSLINNESNIIVRIINSRSGK